MFDRPQNILPTKNVSEMSSNMSVTRSINVIRCQNIVVAASTVKTWSGLYGLSSLKMILFYSKK